MKKFEMLQELLNVTQRHKVSKCFWINGAHRVATDLQFVINSVCEISEVKYTKAQLKKKKMKYACVVTLFSVSTDSTLTFIISFLLLKFILFFF